MIYLIATLLAVTNAFWLLLTLLTLPGNWLMVTAAALVAWWRWDERMFSPWTLLVILGLALVGELVELLASSVAVKRSGGSRIGSFGALLGAILGAVLGTIMLPIPLLGSLVGACGGACAGAWAGDLAAGRPHRASARSGVAAGAGRLFATVAKFAVGALIWIIITVASFWP